MEKREVDLKQFVPQKIGRAYQLRMVFYFVGIAFSIYMIYYLKQKTNTSTPETLPKEIQNFSIEE
jgi:hypothetical protein